jgi:hypothetical protein
MNFPPPEGIFAAYGSAVDEGLVCGTGDVVEISGRILVQNVQGMNLQIIHRFACDDGSGTFDVKLQVRIHRGVNNFHWVIVGGTGDYVNLRGRGSGVGHYGTGPDVLDVYSGRLH